MNLSVKKAFIWFLMLTKRLYKKASFLAILVLIPIVVLAYGQAAKSDSGILTVALAAEDINDPVSKEIIEQLIDSSPLIRYVVCDTAMEAEEFVRMFRVDAAWVFLDHTGQRIHDFISDSSERRPIVQVITREKNLAIMLAGEKLSGILFSKCARAYYLYYLRGSVDELAAYSDEEILSHYDGALIGDQLFSFTNTTGDEGVSNTDNYLLSPMRGLLGVIIILCGLATAMYYTKDNAGGMFAFLPIRKKAFAEFGYQSVSLINITIVAFISLCILGVSVDLAKELLILVMYCLCAISFCVLVRVCCHKLRSLGTAMVLLTVLMIAVCPIFYDFSALRTLQLLFPPTYFVNAAYNFSYYWNMVAHTILCAGLSWAVRVVTKRY